MKERKRFLRPVAWVALIVLVNLMCIVAELLQRLGIFLVGLISPLPTWAIVALVVAFGSMYFGLIGYAACLLPTVVVTATEWIYPTKHAARYYVYSISSILFYIASMIWSANGVMTYQYGAFWFYALCVYDIILLVFLMVFGTGKAKEWEEIRNKEQEARKQEEHAKADEVSSLKKELSEAEGRSRIILEYSQKTCREIANVPQNVEFNASHWPVSINGISYMVYVDQNGEMYHKEDCPHCNMGRVTNVFNLPRNCSPCQHCQPIQVYGAPQWLTDYWNAIAVKEKCGILDPDIPREEN